MEGNTVFPEGFVDYPSAKILVQDRTGWHKDSIAQVSPSCSSRLIALSPPSIPWRL